MNLFQKYRAGLFISPAFFMRAIARGSLDKMPVRFGNFSFSLQKF